MTPARARCRPRTPGTHPRCQKSPPTCRCRGKCGTQVAGARGKSESARAHLAQKAYSPLPPRPATSARFPVAALAPIVTWRPRPEADDLAPHGSPPQHRGSLRFRRRRSGHDLAFQRQPRTSQAPGLVRPQTHLYGFGFFGVRDSALIRGTPRSGRPQFRRTRRRSRSNPGALAREEWSA